MYLEVFILNKKVNFIIIVKIDYSNLRWVSINGQNGDKCLSRSRFLPDGQAELISLVCFKGLGIELEHTHTAVAIVDDQRTECVGVVRPAGGVVIRLHARRRRDFLVQTRVTTRCTFRDAAKKWQLLS